MKEEEAWALAERLSREHPDRACHRWVAREGAGSWEVVKVALPEGVRREPLKATTEAKPKPPQADDPRYGPLRDIPPYA